MGEVLHVGIDHVDAVGQDIGVGPLPRRKPRLHQLLAVVPVEGLHQTAASQVAGRLHTDEAATLRQARGAERAIRRADMPSMRANGLSMMPEELEIAPDPQGMANLSA